MVNFIVEPIAVGYSRVFGVFYEDDENLEHVVDTRATEDEAIDLANSLKSKNRKPRKIFEEE